MSVSFSVRITMITVLMMPFSTPVFADQEEAARDLAAGGRLYDKWWKQARLSEPKSTHPSYPKTGKKSGSTTWRCKECHGWDYQGKGGAYAEGSHFTGIKGIYGMNGKSVDKIESILKNTTHGYDKVLRPNHLARLARFVSQGQVDMNRYIDRKTRRAKGATSKGAKIYQDYCVECHGDDGQEYNFKKKSGGQEFLGTIANKNPWEALHKIINGHPGETDVDMRARMHREGMGPGMLDRMGRGRHMWETMPAMRGRIADKQWADLLAYLQTLPK